MKPSLLARCSLPPPERGTELVRQHYFFGPNPSADYRRHRPHAGLWLKPAGQRPAKPKEQEELQKNVTVLRYDYIFIISLKMKISRVFVEVNL